jgi:hypothetical protein
MELSDATESQSFALERRNTTAFHQLPHEILLDIFALLASGYPDRNSLAPENGNFVEEEFPSLTSHMCGPRPSALITATVAILQPTLASFTRLNRFWNSVAEQLLYRNIVVERLAALYALRRTLKNKRALRSYVQSITYLPPAHELFNQRPRLECIILEDIYELCPRIKTHRLNFALAEDIRTSLDRADGDSPHMPHLSCRAFQDLALSLTRLEVITPYRRNLLDFIPSCDFPLLQDLILSGCLIPLVELSMTASTAHTPLRWPNMPLLQRLRLVNGDFAKDSRFPAMSSLRVFEIVGGRIYSVVEVLRSIISIAPDLEVLTIVPDSVVESTWFANYGLFKKLVQLRVSTTALRIAFRQGFPWYLKVFENVDDGLAIHEAYYDASRGPTSYDAREWCPELDHIRIYAVRKNFFIGCSHLSMRIKRQEEIAERNGQPLDRLTIEIIDAGKYTFLPPPCARVQFLMCCFVVPRKTRLTKLGDAVGLSESRRRRLVGVLNLLRMTQWLSQIRR